MANRLLALLEIPALAVLGRVLLTFPFWMSGIAKLADFPGAIGEMQHFNLEPAAFFAVATIFVQLLGSMLVISGRAAWLGAGALVVFTLATIPIAHDFWNMAGPVAFHEMLLVTEHIGIVGGMIVAAVLWRVRPKV